MAKKRGSARQPEPLQVLKSVAWTHPDRRGPMRELWRRRKAGGLLSAEEADLVWQRIERGHFVFDLVASEEKGKENG